MIGVTFAGLAAALLLGTGATGTTALAATTPAAPLNIGPPHAHHDGGHGHPAVVTIGDRGRDPVYGWGRGWGVRSDHRGRWGGWDGRGDGWDHRGGWDGWDGWDHRGWDGRGWDGRGWDGGR